MAPFAANEFNTLLERFEAVQALTDVARFFPSDGYDSDLGHLTTTLRRGMHILRLGIPILIPHLRRIRRHIRLPKVTIYGVWNEKDGRHWQHEQLDADCQSPKIEPQLERDLTLLDATS